MRRTVIAGVALLTALGGCGKKEVTRTSDVPEDVLNRSAAPAPPADAQLEPSTVEKHAAGAYSRSAKAMGTRVTVTIWTDDEPGAAKVTSDIFGEFERVDRLMSSWLPDSDVSRINAGAGKAPVAISDEVLGVIQKSIEISKLTQGAFDITVGSFRGLWKFDQDLDGTIPTRAQVEKRRKLVDYRKIQVDPAGKTVFLPTPGTRITLGGIAKGYTVDRAVEMLRERGFNSFIVQAGGDLYVSGRKGNRPWIVGIRDPRGPRNDSFALLPLTDGTFSTSGDYERGLVVDGVRYHHIIDPATGYPATKSRSVTVLAKDAITADVLSTSLFILGDVVGMKMVEKMPDVEAVFVDSKNQVKVSSGLKNRLQILHQPTDGV